MGGGNDVLPTTQLIDKMDIKKIWLQAFLAAFIMLADSQFASAETVNIGGINYNLNNSDMTAEVAENYEASGSIVLPATLSHEGRTYTLTAIGYDAFDYCEGLTAITLPEGLATIGGSAFYGCESLAAITIPASVTSIGREAFAACTGLASMTVAAGNKVYDSRGGCNAIIETATGTLAFGCKTSRVPHGVTAIGDEAFYKCSTLAAVTLPQGVTSIGEYAFYKCSALASINLPEGLVSIGESAFHRCGKLTALALPASLATIGEDAFYDCSGLGSISVAAGNKVYDSRNGCNAVIETATGTLVLGCKTTVVPGGVTAIGDNAFAECGITSVDLPASVTTIGMFAFSECMGLTSVTLPEGMATVGMSAFWGCANIATLSLPSTLETVADDAFGSCSSLKDVYCYGTAKKTAGPNAFSSIAPGAVLHVHGSLLEAYRADTRWADSFAGIVALPGTETGISQVDAAAPGTCRIYTIDGKPLSAPQRGISIMRTAGGKSIKVAR